MPAKKRIKLEQPEIREAEFSTALDPTVPDPQAALNSDAGEDQEELPPYHEYHAHRNLRAKAIYLMKDKGLKLANLPPTVKKLLRPFIHRYYAGIEKPENSNLYHFAYTHQQKWVKATLVVALTTERWFEGEWCWTQYDAEVSAIEAFRSDEEVLEIAENLPPMMNQIKKSVTLRREEKDRLHAANIPQAVVMKELIQAVYIHFRDLGCRTAIWDGVM